jgi:hypothetical protein
LLDVQVLFQPLTVVHVPPCGVNTFSSSPTPHTPTAKQIFCQRLCRRLTFFPPILSIYKCRQQKQKTNRHLTFLKFPSASIVIFIH